MRRITDLALANVLYLDQFDTPTASAAAFTRFQRQRADHDQWLCHNDALVWHLSQPANVSSRITIARNQAT
jgi:hypothetical protein